MKRQTRKQLKTDEVAEGLGSTWSFLWTKHRQETIRYGSIALAVAVVVAAYVFYNRYESGVREAALTQAMRIDEAIIGPANTPTNLAFPTKDAKAQARYKAFSDLMVKYHGTPEGAFGGIYTAAAEADKGNLAGAEKIYKDVMDSAPKDYASLAQVSLAELYAAEGKTADAQKLLQELVDHPTDLVSSEQAKLELANVLAKSNPQEALKMLSPLSTGRTAVSKVAIEEEGKIAQEVPPQK